MRFYLLFILLLALGTGRGQDFKHNYYPMRPVKVPKVVLKDIFTGNEKIAASRPIDNASVKKDFIRLVKESHKHFAELDTIRVLMYQDTLTVYIRQVVEKVMAANPEFAGKQMHVFSIRDEEINAANHGPLLVTFNLGLLAQARTYEEFVFVICHELSHEYLDHHYNSVETISSAINNRDFKKKARKLKRQEYNSVKQAELLLNKTIAGIARNSRAQELQADSMGLVFYNRMQLNSVYALSMIRLLDSSDVPYMHGNLNYKNDFDPEKTFFDDTWLVKDTGHYSWQPDSSIWVLADSLKTHPDCKIRFSKLQYMSSGFSSSGTVDQKDFIYMRNVARFELLEEYLSNEDYATSLYYAMQLQQNFPNNIYLKNVVLNSLVEMSNALKEHRFSQVVDHPSYFYYPGFNSHLYFLHNLNSSSLRKMAVNYFKNNLQQVQNDDFTGYNAILMKSWDMKKEKYPELIDIYKTNFKDKFYLKKLETKFKPKK